MPRLRGAGQRLPDGPRGQPLPLPVLRRGRDAASARHFGRVRGSREPGAALADGVTPRGGRKGLARFGRRPAVAQRPQVGADGIEDQRRGHPVDLPPPGALPEQVAAAAVERLTAPQVPDRKAVLDPDASLGLVPAREERDPGLSRQQQEVDVVLRGELRGERADLRGNGVAQRDERGVDAPADVVARAGPGRKRPHEAVDRGIPLGERRNAGREAQHGRLGPELAGHAVEDVVVLELPVVRGGPVARVAPPLHGEVHVEERGEGDPLRRGPRGPEAARGVGGGVAPGTVGTARAARKPREASQGEGEKDFPRKMRHRR